MAMNRIQFQRGMSLPQFFARYGSEEQCESALMALRWYLFTRPPSANAGWHPYLSRDLKIYL